MLPKSLTYWRILPSGDRNSLSIGTDGAIAATSASRALVGKLTSGQAAEALAILEGWHEIRLRPWLLRSWTADPTDVMIQYGWRKVHACDLSGRNSTFWRLEHFLDQLLSTLRPAGGLGSVSTAAGTEPDPPEH